MVENLLSGCNATFFPINWSMPVKNVAQGVKVLVTE